MILDLYKEMAWDNKPEIIKLFNDVTPKFLKEVAQRVFLEVGIKDTVMKNGDEKPINIFEPHKFTYVEDFKYNRFTSAEYMVYDASLWDPFTVRMTPYEITLTSHVEDSREDKVLFSVKGNLALTFYFKEYFNFEVTEEEIETIRNY